MRLSEAIRLGAMLHPQAFGAVRIYGVNNRNTVLRTCALGAAQQAGFQLSSDLWEDPRFPCPACLETSRRLYAMVTHLNDDHRWTREAIADFVASIEPPTESPVARDAVGLWEVPTTDGPRA